MKKDKQHVIIFDGPDMCGKTQMAQALSKRLGVGYFKNKRESKFFREDPGYFQKALKYGDPFFASYLKQTGASVIMDRSYPSEYVYSRVFGRETNADILRMVDTMFSDVGALIIIPFRTSYEKIKDDQFSEIDATMLEQIDKLYDEFSLWTSCRVLKLNVDNENLEQELAEILDFIYESQ